MCLDTKETKFSCCKDFQTKQKMALFYSFIYFIFWVIFKGFGGYFKGLFAQFLRLCKEPYITQL